MKKLLTAFILFVGAFFLSAFAPAGYRPANAVLSSSSSASYLFNLGFEETGTPSGFSTLYGTPDYDYTTAPLIGSQSLYLGSGVINYLALGSAYDEVWVFFHLKADMTTAISGGGIAFTDSSGNDQGVVALRSGGAPLRMLHGESGWIYAPDAADITSESVFWIHYAKNTSTANGVLQVYANANSSSEARGTVLASTSIGTGTAISRLTFEGNSAGVIVDKVIVSISEVTSSP